MSHLIAIWLLLSPTLSSLVETQVMTYLDNEGQGLPRIGSNWIEIGQFWDFLTSITVHFGTGLYSTIYCYPRIGEKKKKKKKQKQGWEKAENLRAFDAK